MIFRILIAVLAIVSTCTVVRAQSRLPGGFVYLRDVAPGILQDIRYAGPNNFIDRPLKGYAAAECIVKPPVAEALARVQTALAARKLSLKMCDCYRPVRAVQDMVAWARDPRETPAQRAYNPNLRKQDLFRLGYMAEHSGHSTGAAVDLTIVDLSSPRASPFDPTASYADCTAPAALRAPDNSLDMGTGYDCSDVKAHTDSPAIDPQQRQSRRLLVAAMAQGGFVNYRKEWWHFTFPGVAAGAYDFPVAPRR